MKKALIALSGFLLGLFFISCTVVVNQPEGKNQKKNSTITGKAFYSNSNDSSSIKVYIEKYSDTGAGRSVLSFSNCAADGTYSFENLEEGVYTVYATSSDSTEKAICRSISVKQNQTVELPDMTLTATGSVSGKISVVDSPEQNLGFIVFIAGTSFMAATDSQGNFKISGVPANPDYQIIVSKGTYSFLWKSNVNVTLLENTDIGEFKITSNVLPYGSTTSSFDIPYELNGGTLPSGAPLTFSYDSVTTLVAPEKQGYHFMGYFFEEDFSGLQITELGENYTPGQKLYAKWMWKQAYDIMNLTQSSVVELTGRITDSDLNDLKNALMELYSTNPEITISLDFSKGQILLSNKLPDFNNCYNLIEITASSALLEIYNSLFAGSITIKKVIICDGIKSIKDNTFDNCSNIQSIVLPESLTSIGSNAFSGCSSLTSITIPQNVIEIKNSAFSGCTHLYEIYNLSDLIFTCGSTDYGYIAYYAKVIHNSLDEESVVFIYTPDGFTFMKAGEDYYLISYTGSETNIVLPDSFEMNNKTITEYAIGNHVFYDYSNLACLIIPASVKSIGENAFAGCKHLYEIYNLSSLNLTCGSKEYGYVAYYAKVIHNSLEEPSIFFITEDGFVFMVIDDYCALFTYINSENSITLPASVVIGNRTITEYEIADYAFEGNSNLQNVTIPNCVIGIGEEAFSGCSGITNLIIPDSVTSIDSGAFSGCTGLTDIKISDNVTIINSSVFSSCINLKNISMPNRITKINNKAFINCRSLKAFSIPESVRYIGDRAFMNCSSLESILIPYGVNKINTETFAGCSNLINITIPNSVTSIGKKAFCDCIKLVDIRIPESVEEIYINAIYGCDNLILIYMPRFTNWDVFLENKLQETFYINHVVDSTSGDTALFPENLSQYNISNKNYILVKH